MDETQIAKLVLGYLKSGNYKASYKHFYKQCPHFEVYRQRKQRISTRYYGLPLLSILQQYYEIYSIVQPLLEDTNYYEDTLLSPNKLPQQVSYLICSLKHSSRPSTPCTSISSPTRPNDMGNDPHSHLSSIDMSGSLDISTTPYESLPGNGQGSRGEPPHRPSGCMFKSPAARRETETEQESSSGEGDKAPIDDVLEVFKETLLGSENLQEKIAHTINEAKSQTAADVLDNTDPLEKLMQEIIGSVSEVVDIDRRPHALTATANSRDTQTQTRNSRADSSSPSASAMNATDGSKHVVYISTPQTATTTQAETFSLSEQDIMSMPIFVCEDKLESKVLVEQAVQVPEKRLKTLMPVRKVANVNTADNIVDFITLYNAHDESPTIVQSSNVPHNVALMDAGRQPERAQSSEFGIFSDVKTPDQTAQMPKPSAPTPRSGHRSHVRALDFKFQTTPAKDALRVTQATSASPKTYSNRKRSPGSKSTTSKSLFGAGEDVDHGGDDGSDRKARKEPWDLKFRTALLAAEAANPTLPKLLAKTSDRKKATKSPNVNIGSTNQRGRGKAGANVGVVSSAGNASTAAGAKKKRGGAARKRTRVGQACAVNASKAAETNETTPKANKSTKSKVPCVEAKKDDFSTVDLINVDRSPLYKTKCNIGNNYAHKTDVKVVLASNAKKDAKGDVCADAAGEKHVLSPSKLNGNRRTLVEAEVGDGAKACSLHTPETSRIEPAAVPSSSRMRDLMPLLVTPAKDECPKTPSVYDPATAADTPFTKVFNEQTAGVDLAGIPTPKCMLTPNFPFTPLLEGRDTTPTYNRPTDYSTSSSYYQPSDTEQNKSLDKLIRECQRLEVEEPEARVQLDAARASTPVATPPPPATAEGAPAAPKAESVNRAVAEKIKSLGSNVIARKNLNLVKDFSNKKPDLNSSNSSNSSCSISGDSSSDSDAEEDAPDNETIVERDDAPRYALRSLPRATSNSGVSTAKPAETADGDKDLPGDDSDSSDAPLMPRASAVSCPGEKPEVDRAEKAEQEEMVRISKIVSNVSFKPVLRESLIKEEGKTKQRNDLEEKRMRVLRDLKGYVDDKPAGRRRAPSARAASRKPKPLSDVRVLRSSAIKLKEEDLHLTSSDSEIEVQPYELVEAVITASSVSNSPVSESVLKELLMRGNLCAGNSPQHDEIFPAHSDAHAEGKSKEKRRKVEKATKKSSKTAKERKRAPKAQVKARSKPGSKKEKTSEMVWKDAENGKKDDKKVLGDVILDEDGHTKNDKNAVLNHQEDDKTSVNIDNKIKTVKQPVETSESVVEEERPLNGVVLEVGVDVSKDNMRCTPVQGSTGEEAKSLKEGLEKMGFPVTERVREREGTQKSTSTSKQKPAATAVATLVRYETFVQYPKEEHIAHCLNALHTSEKEYIYLDTKVFTDPIGMMASEGAPEARRDAEDDKKRTTKSYKMTVYEDETDAEIEKVMHVTPFQSLFEYCVIPVETVVTPPAPPMLTKKKVIDVLDNIVVKQDKVRKEPLFALMKAAIGEKMACDKNGRNEAQSNQSSRMLLGRSDDRKGKTIITNKMPEKEKEEIREKKRKFENTSQHDDITKKSKMTEHHNLLKGLNVDNVLEQLYNN